MFSILLIGLALAVQTVPDNCRDDKGVDRCDQKQQAHVRELFGVQSIEEHARAGNQVRRVFYVDGYGRDIIAIEFIRPRGGDPVAFVNFPRAKDGKRAHSLQAAVPKSAWERILRSSSHFDRVLVPLAEVRAEPVICIHSWVYTVEATDPADEHDRGRTRRRTEDACEDGLTETFATEVYKLTVPLFPHCDLLDRSKHRNEATLLANCAILKGDRIVAAIVMNEVDALRFISGPADAAAIMGIFDYRASIDWAGERHSGPKAAEFWIRKVREGGRANLFIEEVVGEMQQRVALRGFLSRSLEQGGYARAPVEQIWRIRGPDVSIERATVGPFRPSGP